MQGNLIKKKFWLDYLFYYINKQNDFRMNCITKKEDKIISSKYKKYSECIFPIDENAMCENKENWIFFNNINNREILPNELVIDIENNSQDNLNRIIKKIKEDKINNAYVWTTHSRGYHIHIFFNKQLSKDEKLYLIKRYEGDENKAGNTMIALEFSPHYKSGKDKEMIWKLS